MAGSVKAGPIEIQVRGLVASIRRKFIYSVGPGLPCCVDVHRGRRHPEANEVILRSPTRI